MSVLAVFLSYLLGSLSFGYLLGKYCKGIDVRKHGSGNVGSTNILRTLGPFYAALVLVLDMGKGVAAVFLGHLLTGSPTVAMVAGIFAVLGHNWPALFGFRGGRGIATSLGVILAFNPTAFGILLALGILIILLFRYVSLASIIGSTLSPVILWATSSRSNLETGRNEILLAIFLAVLAVVKHRDNIQRLVTRTERKIGERVKYQ